MRSTKTFTSQKLAAAALAVLASSACTGQVPGSFTLAGKQQAFTAQLQVNTKIDLLWVVDNSSSMDVSQDKLRKGFSSFAARYMQPTWDVRVAVITTDTYLAHPAFSGFLNQVIPGTVNWSSDYMAAKTKAVTNPIYNPVSKTFPAGVRYRDLVPAWGSNYARLLSGLHDGPIAGLCSEILPYFLHGATKCDIRDDLSSNTGSASCLNPIGLESSLTECVNTMENNTVRSGRPVVSTAPPAGVLGDPVALANHTQQLAKDFMVNVTTGSVGFGSERGLSSFVQLLADNESGGEPFFRKGSLRGVIFVSDEDDQSMEIPANPPAGFSPWSYYACDQTSLLSLNPGKAALITGMNGYCCNTPGNNCRYGSEGTSCPSKIVDGVTVTMSICPRQEKLIPVSTIKQQIDGFFKNLDAVDGVPASEANYFVAAIVPLTDADIITLQTSRDHDDTEVGVAIKTKAVDQGTRYAELVDQVGNGSLKLNIAAENYTPVLDAIGKSIIEKKSRFLLDRVPASVDEMLVRLIHADGTSVTIPSSKLAIEGKTLVITDEALILSFASTDTIDIDYQPKSLY